MNEWNLWLEIITVKYNDFIIAMWLSTIILVILLSNMNELNSRSIDFFFDLVFGYHHHHSMFAHFVFILFPTNFIPHQHTHTRTHETLSWKQFYIFCFIMKLNSREILENLNNEFLKFMRFEKKIFLYLMM